jgi:hypothetical protein
MGDINEQNNSLSGSTKIRALLDQLSYCDPLKEYPAS